MNYPEFNCFLGALFLARFFIIFSCVEKYSEKRYKVSLKNEVGALYAKMV